MEGTHTQADAGFSTDLLRGANEIAAFLFGSAKHRRRVYHLVETSKLPVFRLGSRFAPAAPSFWSGSSIKRSGGRLRHPESSCGLYPMVE